MTEEIETIEKDQSLELHQLLDEHEIVQLSQAFESKEGKRMTKAELKEELKVIAGVEMDDERYAVEFLRMNAQCNGLVSWDEFISYLILGYEHEEVSLEYKTLDAPIPLPPTLLKSNHRYCINRIAFYPTVKPDRSVTWHDCSIMTCSNDGVINYWSLDMLVERTVQSKCPYLKIGGTWVTDMAILPDVSVIVTSSSERDLRFYDTSARKFELRVMITSIPNAVMCMHYCFDQDVNVPSKLICGDMAGNIITLFIYTEGRGAFISQPGVMLRQVRYSMALEGAIPEIKIVEYPKIHTDFVRQVSYYTALNCIVSCAECPNGMVMSDIAKSKPPYIYKILHGVWCFALLTEAHMVATGGPDCAVRIWNPFVPTRPICTFYGHHTGIVQMVFQDNGQKLYSLSNDKCIKVWDVGLQSLLQTYLELPSQLAGERSNLVTLYNPTSRQWIIGSSLIAIVPLNPKLSSEHTEGYTHTSGVSVILYNKLFKSVVTCGLDSYVIVWDPWDGRRLLVIKDAHTQMLHGEVVPVEITAATFDLGYQRLLTGAHDGTLKIWNFNTGTCLRNMNIDSKSEVRSVIWVKGRIMAIGWNKRVTEFADTGEAVGPGGAFRKDWDKRHREDINVAAVRIPETLATATYSGELLFWRLETGQPYKKFDVHRPTARIKIYYQQKSKTPKRGTTSMAAIRRRSSTQAARGSFYATRDESPMEKMMALPKGQRQRRVSKVAMPEECFRKRNLGVHAMLFLNTRKTNPKIGTLLISVEDGMIQVWSHHVAGGFITSFNAIHKAGDYIISMTTDEHNEYLFTGTTVGYIKTWLLKNYCVLPEDEEPICMPKYRDTFPFMWDDTFFLGRAKRMTLNQPKPILLNSYKGHYRPVSGLVYIDPCQILISSSADFSARMWTISGRYIQTIGTFKPWKLIQKDTQLPQDFNYSIPVDIRRVASSTTYRVLAGGSFPKRLTIKQLQKQAQKDLIHIDKKKIYGERLEDPILGNYFGLDQRTTKLTVVHFDNSFPQIPVYQHLIMPEPKNIDFQDVPNGVKKKVAL